MSDVLWVREVCAEHSVADSTDVECDGCDERKEIHDRVPGWVVHACFGGREIVLRKLYFPVDAWQEVDDDE